MTGSAAYGAIRRGRTVGSQVYAALLCRRHVKFQSPRAALAHTSASTGEASAAAPVARAAVSQVIIGSAAGGVFRRGRTVGLQGYAALLCRRRVKFQSPRAALAHARDSYCQGLSRRACRARGCQSSYYWFSGLRDYPLRPHSSLVRLRRNFYVGVKSKSHHGSRLPGAFGSVVCLRVR